MSRFMNSMARAMAILGGVVLAVLIVLVCVSVTGRGANTLAHWNWLEQNAPGISKAILSTAVGPLQGDFELVEAGIAFAIFSFLPLCQIRGGHATVDIFTVGLSRRINTWLIAFWEILLSALVVLITIRLAVGMFDKIDNGETTFILQFPVWWAYGASLVAALIASIVSIYCAMARVAEAITQKQIMPNVEGADH